MLSNKMIALFLLIGITFGAASLPSPGQGAAPDKAKVSQSASPASLNRATPKAASKTAIGSQKMTKPVPPAQYKQSSQTSTIHKSPPGAVNLKKGDAEQKATSSDSVKASRPLEGRIERKKPSVLKEILKDEFDGPIHPVTTDNKNF